jgi:hypothetical protein
MTPPSDGTTQAVIREVMLPYHLSADLLAATLAALPPPPHDASPVWQQARVTRLIEEIGAFLPADAGQARLASQILIMSELAGTVATRSYAPEVTVDQMSRLRRTSAELGRTVAMLVRTLQRRQQQPVPLFGTVVEDEIAIAAAAWHNNDI